MCAPRGGQGLQHGSREVFPVEETVYSECYVGRISSTADFQNPMLGGP